MCASWLSSIWSFLNSNFSTAFFGAVAGSLTIFFIDWLGRQRRILADINASIGVLTGLMNTYLNIKRQHVMPVYQNYQENRYIFENLKKQNNSKINTQEVSLAKFSFNLKNFFCPDLHFDLPLERVFALTDKHPQIVQIILQAKRSVGEVEVSCQIWNELVGHAKKLDPAQSIPFYFGIRLSSGVTDTYFPDTVQNLCTSIDDALFFTNRSIEALRTVGNASLPYWLKKKVARFDIVDDEHKALMPGYDYKSGW